GTIHPAKASCSVPAVRGWAKATCGTRKRARSKTTAIVTLRTLQRVRGEGLQTFLSSPSFRVQGSAAVLLGVGRFPGLPGPALLSGSVAEGLQSLMLHGTTKALTLISAVIILTSCSGSLPQPLPSEQRITSVRV